MSFRDHLVWMVSSMAKRTSLSLIQPGENGGSYSKRKDSPLVLQPCSLRTFLSSSSFSQTCFSVGTLPCQEMLAIFWAGTSWIATFLLFGMGNVSIVHSAGITKDTVQPRVSSVSWMVTGAVMAIFSGPLWSGATLSPKIQPAISLNPKFMAVYMSSEQQVASAVRQEGY